MDKAVENFLSLVASKLNLLPAIKALEWLVRRFQIHVHNAELLVLTALPYYSAPVFVRILDIIPTLPKVFSFLSSSKKSVQNPSRNLLVRALTTDAQLCQLVQTYVVKVISDGRAHSVLLAFWSSTSIWTIVSLKESRTSEEVIVERFLPPISTVLPLRKESDAQIAAYMILAVLVSQARLEKQLKVAAIETIVKNWSKASQKSGLACVTQIVKDDDEVLEISKDTWEAVDKVKGVDSEIIELAEKYNIESFVELWCLSVFQHFPEKVSTATKVLMSVKLSNGRIVSVVEYALDFAIKSPRNESKASLVKFFETLLSSESTAKLVKEALQRKNITFENLELLLESSISAGAAIDEANETENMGNGDVPEPMPAKVQEDSETVMKELEKLPSSGNSVSFLTADSTEEFQTLATMFSRAVSANITKNIMELLKIQTSTSLSFLARVWTGSYAIAARAHALNCAIKILEQDQSTDYQALIPELISGLCDSSERIRRLAGSALEILSQRYPLKKAPVWAIDDLYGKNDSADLKFLNSDSVTTLLKDHLLPNIQECILDSSRVFIIMGQAMNQKKLGELLRQVITSHALAIKLPLVKTILFKMVNHAGARAVGAEVAPFLEGWLADREFWKTRCSEEKASFDNLEAEVVSLASPYIKQSPKFLQSCVKSEFSSLNDLAAKKIVSNWASMKLEAKLSMLRFLIDIYVDENENFDSAEIFNNDKFVIPAEAFLALLKESQVTTESEPASVAKRRRRSSASAAKQLSPGGDLVGYAEKLLRRLTVICELLERKKPESHSDLLAQLFNTLRDFLSIGTDTNLPVHYVQQAIANCMIFIVDQLKQRGEIPDTNSIRIDIIVSCIRASNSIQVQNRFLLLVASLAGLDKEIVLHSVMPIFTFMGANTLRQDDELSAHVIQQTIQQVVPALIASDDMQDEIDFLLFSFTAAFSHIPRHRRVKLYGTLVKTIGVEDSFSRFMWLLGEKYSEVTVKRKSLEAKNLIQFGDSFSRGFPVSDEVSAIKGYLDLIASMPEADSEEPPKSKLYGSIVNFGAQELATLKANLYTFISGVIGSEDSFKTRLLVQLGSDDEETTKTMKTNLSNIIQLVLTTISSAESPAPVSEAAFDLLSALLEALPIGDFVEVAGMLINSESSEASDDIRARLLVLMQSKFAAELSSDEDARAAAYLCIEIVQQYLSKRELHDSSKNLIQLCLDALDVLVANFGTEKQSDKLLSVLSDIVVFIKSSEEGIYVSAVAAVNSLCTVLGARMIGHFAKIVPVVFSRIESDESEVVQLAGFGLISGLMRRIPSFMTSSLNKVFELVFKSSAPQEQRNRLMQVVVENNDQKNIISSLAATWKYALENGLEAVYVHLDTMDLSIDISSKKDINSQSAKLVAFVLDAFRVRGSKQFETNNVNRIETRVIATAMAFVMKMNDKNFRPLFIRMVRWAVEGEGSDRSIAERDRLVVFFKFFIKVLQSLKSIVTNYYGYLVDPVCTILERRGKDSADEVLKRAILNSLVTSFQFDRDEFWQSQSRFNNIQKALIGQISVIEPGLGNLLVRSIASLAELCSSPDNNKVINDSVCEHMKESSTKHEKIWAVRTLKALYSRLGEEWVTMLPQLVPIIAELLEDDEAVEDEVRKKLVPVVEEVLGESLDKYLA